MYFCSIFAEADTHKDVFKMTGSEARFWFVLSADGAAEGGPPAERDAGGELGDRPAAAAGAGADLHDQHSPVWYTAPLPGPGVCRCDQNE